MYSIAWLEEATSQKHRKWPVLIDKVEIKIGKLQWLWRNIEIGGTLQEKGMSWAKNAEIETRHKRILRKKLKRKCSKMFPESSWVTLVNLASFLDPFG